MRSTFPVLLLLGLAPTLPAQALVHEVIYTTLPGWPQSDVPGLPGVHLFDSSSYSWERSSIAVGPNGDHVLMAATDDFYGVRLVLLVNGQLVLAEGDPAPWAPGETVELGNSSVAMNRYGEVGLQSFTNGPSATDGYLLRYDGGWTLLAQEGGAVPGVSGATFTSFKSLAALGLDDAGQAAHFAYLTGAPFSSGLFHAGGVLVRAGLDAPTGQLSGLNDPYTAFENGNQVRISPDGQHWSTNAFLIYPNVVAVDGAVVVQEGYAIPGSGSATLAWDITDHRWDAANRWYGLGRYLPNGRSMWAVRDGALLAATGQETFPGSGYAWNEQIEFVCGAANGDFYVGGDYLVPPYGLGRVIVKNGAAPLLTDGDVIDMDGDGVYSDNVTMILLESTGYASEDGSLYTVIRARDNNTNTYGSVFLRIGPPRPVLELRNLVAGQTAEIEVSLAQPGDLVLMGYSLRGGGPTTVPSPWGSLEVALTPPFERLPSLAADPNGVALRTAAVPAGASGVQVWAHAAVVHANRATLTLPVTATVL
ncbi:MAG: hypothetical protein H8E31_07455 [Planctomycetes bacterium]|nr:hypothetical protein [Planctomycetota bacterium]